MKKKLLGLAMAVVAMSMMLVSCNKAEKQILGTWVSNANSYVDIFINGEQLEKQTYEAGQITFIFNEDGTMNDGKATYALDGDKLTITAGGESLEYDIITLEKKVLVLETTHEETLYGQTSKTVQHLEFDKQ